MTTCKDLGYGLGDKFVVIKELSFTLGSVVELYRDAYKDSSLFKLITGECDYNNCGGEKGAWDGLYSLLPFNKEPVYIKGDYVEDFSKLKEGDKAVFDSFKRGGHDHWSFEEGVIYSVCTDKYDVTGFLDADGEAPSQNWGFNFYYVTEYNNTVSFNTRKEAREVAKKLEGWKVLHKKALDGKWHIYNPNLVLEEVVEETVYGETFYEEITPELGKIDPKLKTGDYILTENLDEASILKVLEAFEKAGYDYWENKQWVLENYKDWGQLGLCKGDGIYLSDCCCFITEDKSEPEEVSLEFILSTLDEDEQESEEEGYTFKLGDKVKISQSSEYYGSSTRNPAEVCGEIVEVDCHLTNALDFPLKVEWENGEWNNYNYEDLYLTEEDTVTSSGIIEKRKPKLLIIGTARMGKDTVAEILERDHGFTFESSSKFMIRKFTPALELITGCNGFEEAYEDRHNHRELLFNMIATYNQKDGARLAKEILAEYDVYCGLRNKTELDECKRQGIFDLIIWVDASDRVAYKESSDSCTVTKEDADIIITNNGSIKELEQKVAALVATFK